MKIGIIGAGNLGATGARVFVNAGHEIAISNSRGPDSLRKLVAELGSRAHAATVDDAARFGDVVLLAVPWRSPEALPKPEAVAGKIVIDAMNPYKPDFTLYDLGDSTSRQTFSGSPPGKGIQHHLLPAPGLARPHRFAGCTAACDLRGRRRRTGQAPGHATDRRDRFRTRRYRFAARRRPETTAR